MPRRVKRFKSWQDYQDFARTVRATNRYIRTPETERFLSVVSETAKSRIITISKDWRFWRAQIGSRTIELEQLGELVDREVAFAPERMKPLRGRAHEGRANPKGIAYLYGATAKLTAMAEVRPRLGAFISLGVFEVIKELKIIDCSRYHARNPFALLFEKPIGYKPTAADVEVAVWTDIDHAFSAPATDADEALDYVPTQILAERFKLDGYDGIAYKSKLTDDGFNLVFFDLEVAKILGAYLYEIKKVTVTPGEHPVDEYAIDKQGRPVWNVITDIRGLTEEERQQLAAKETAQP